MCYVLSTEYFVYFDSNGIYMCYVSSTEQNVIVYTCFNMCQRSCFKFYCAILMVCFTEYYSFVGRR